MDAWVVAVLALAAALVVVFAAKRRSARRAAEARERARRQRRRMPVVSANVRGLPHGEEPDLWAGENAARKDRVA